ncbi:amidase [Pseudalkalibacillus decolorationis]|uniref:amidase n=1 Tax=Pseudalkalibacillus decolorationis TaxID=163879 RepID=UPI00214948C5|nr:amidase [Pseudalkalibacillus decolorationis]
MYGTIKELMDGYKSKQVSPIEVTKWYLDRIKRLDPRINSYITVTEEIALQQAIQAEKRLMEGEDNNFLGVPLAYKDSIDTKGILTTSGSIIDKDRFPEEDAVIVKDLEREGGIQLGKNNMYEYAFGITSQNPFYGDVINPWDRKRTAGGSSGGSAAAVAANLCLGSIGTDTAGSIRVPSACCGVVGLKPTYGLVRMEGMTPLAWSLDHAGPIARTVEDVAFIMQALTKKSYTMSFTDNLKGLRIGIPNHFFTEQMENEVQRMYEKAAQQLGELGADLVEVDVSFLENVLGVATTIGTSEVGYVHKDRIQSSLQLYSEEAQNTFSKSRAITALEYVTALKKREEFTHKVSAVFSKVDVMLTPVTPIKTTDVEMNQVTINGVRESIGESMIRYTSLFNITGHPALSIPMGLTHDETPIGLQLIANHHREDLLFRAAYSYEQYALPEFYKKRTAKCEGESKLG